MANNVDLVLQADGLPELTGKLDYAGKVRTTDLACIDGQSLRIALAEREQQLAAMLEKLRERS